MFVGERGVIQRENSLNPNKSITLNVWRSYQIFKVSFFTNSNMEYVNHFGLVCFKKKKKSGPRAENL